MSHRPESRRVSTHVVLLLGAALLWGFAGPAAAESQKVSICHIPPGNPGNAHVISVSENAVAAHLVNHGDEVVPEDDSCTAGVGECAVDDFLACTADGLVCNAEPAEPPEAAEATCDDGRDNDCDGLIDDQDDDCVVPAVFSETFPPSNRLSEWNAFENDILATTVYNTISFFSDTDPGFTCTGPEANTICQAIRTQTDERCVGVGTPDVSVLCDGNTWAVGLPGGTALSVNTNHERCGYGTAIRAEFGGVCVDPGFDAYGAVNGDVCSSTTTTMTVICE